MAKASDKANTNSATPTLSDDASLWYDLWTAQRTRMADAYKAALNRDEDAEAQAVNVDPDCVPTASGTVCDVISEAFTPLPGGVRPETFVAPFPLSNELYADLNNARLTQKDATKTVPMQLQLSVLEGYRKVFLHKKWRRCHHMLAFMSSMVDNESQYQTELKTLMLGGAVGIKDKTPGEG